MIKIIKATKKDLPDLLNLWRQLIGYHKPLNPDFCQFNKNSKNIMRKFFIKNIQNKNSLVIIAKDNNHSIGYLMAITEKLPPITIEEKIARITDGFIMQQYRRKGIMKKMVKQAKSFYRKRKIKHIYLRTLSKNMKGVNSWKRIGFNEEFKQMFMKL